jgi:hypothetical protein
MRTRRVRPLALVCGLSIALLVGPAAQARNSRVKSIWGPAEVAGVSQFPIYEDLGVGIYQTQLHWDRAAPTRPGKPRDPADPAYRWPGELDFVLGEAQRYGIQVSVQLIWTPPWANGGAGPRRAPTRPRDFASFAAAASRRYPGVRYWMIWSEPSKGGNFQPLSEATSPRARLTPRQRQGPEIYARMLDGAYGSLKRVDRRDLVIGGNTFTTGTIIPFNFIRAMRLPNGRPPRLDLYGHNPFTLRRPALDEEPFRYGYADFSDLDTLARWVDRFLLRRGTRRPRLFLSEFTLPTDHVNHEFNFYVSRRTQASWLASALRIARRWKRIYTLGWLSLYDDPPRPAGDEVNRGLLERDGTRKPAYRTFKRG